jgi:hypothetical protein
MMWLLGRFKARQASLIVRGDKGVASPLCEDRQWGHPLSDHRRLRLGLRLRDKRP